jgi:hypothetical protein
MGFLLTSKCQSVSKRYCAHETKPHPVGIPTKERLYLSFKPKKIIREQQQIYDVFKVFSQELSGLASQKLSSSAAFFTQNLKPETLNLKP